MYYIRIAPEQKSVGKRRESIRNQRISNASQKRTSQIKPPNSSRSSAVETPTPSIGDLEVVDSDNLGADATIRMLKAKIRVLQEISFYFYFFIYINELLFLNYYLRIKESNRTK